MSARPREIALTLTLALFTKTFREHRATFVGILIALVLAEIGIAMSYRAFGKMYESMLSMMSPAMMNAFFGGTLTVVNAVNGWMIGGFVHPIVMLLLSSFIIAVATRALAGEVERGTIDILLACPVSRPRIVGVAMAAMVWGLVLLLGGIYTGTAIGAALAGASREVDFRALALLVVNLFALFLAIGGYSFLFSALCSERGRAIAWAASVTAASWFINFLAEMWDKLQPLRTFSVFRYYQAQPILVSGHLTGRDLVVLLSVALVSSALALIVFRRRDIATV